MKNKNFFLKAITSYFFIFENIYKFVVLNLPLKN